MPFKARPILSPFSSSNVGHANVGVLKTSAAHSLLIALVHHRVTCVNWRVKRFQVAFPSY